MAKINISAHLKSRNPEYNASLYLHYKYNRVVTGLTCKAAEWDKKTQQFSNEYPNRVELNDKLGSYVAKLKTIIREQIQDNEKEARKNKQEVKPLDWEKVKHEFHVEIGRIPREEKKTELVKFELHRRLEAKKSSIDISRSTWKVYGNAVNLFDKFLGSTYYPFGKKELMFEMVNLSFYESFKKFMFSRGHQVGYVINMTKRIMRLMKECHKDGTNNNLISFNIEIASDLGLRESKKKTKKRVLSTKDLKKLMNAKLTGSSEKGRDAIVLASLTGLRISDWHKVNTNKQPIINVGGVDFVVIKTTKTRNTGNEALVPLLGTSKAILSKYNGRFPFADKHPEKDLKVINDAIKSGAQKAGFTAKFDKVLEMPTGKEIETVFEYATITSGVGRHSFTTICETFGIPEKHIKLMRGDSKGNDILQTYNHAKLEDVIKRAIPFLIDIEKELGGWNYEEKKLKAV